MVVLDHLKVLEGNSGNNGNTSEALRKPSPILSYGGVDTTVAGSMLHRNAVLNTPALQSSPYVQPLTTDSEVRTIMWSIIFN